MLNGGRKRPAPDDHRPDRLAEIIDLLRTKTSHDFSLYKPGTLQRRIERRMAHGGDRADDSGRYLDMLRQDAGELELLAKDLLINVTSFFRDPKAFEFLAEKVIPDLVRGTRRTGRCASGLPAAARARRPIPSPCSSSRRSRRRSGTSSCRSSPPMSTRMRSPSPARASIRKRSRRTCRRRGSPASSTKEDHGYRVVPELRGAVVFTVQDVLADPPFSRLDLVSCRNLLIYLRPEAQAKVVSAIPFRAARGRRSVARRLRDGRQRSTTGSSRSPRRSGSIGRSAAAGRAKSDFPIGPARGARESLCARPDEPGAGAAHQPLASSADGCCSRPMRRLRS